MTQDLQKLSSRDLLTSAATLRGLSIAALSFMASFGSSISDILGKVSILLGFPVAIFVATVVALSIKEFAFRFKVWIVALSTYSVGWILIGILIVELAIKLLSFMVRSLQIQRLATNYPKRRRKMQTLRGVSNIWYP